MFDWIKKRIADRAAGTPAANVDLTAQHAGKHESVKKRQGDEHTRAGRYAEAELCYRCVLESDAAYPGAIVGLGFVLRAQGRTNEARDVLERAVKIAADDADAHYLLAAVLQQSEPGDAEISHLKKAIQLRPDFELAQEQLITALIRSARFAEAIACCERALALNPGLLSAQQSLSRLLLDTGQLDAAEASYRREIEITPQHFAPYHQLGVVLHRMARHGEATDALKRAISLNPNSSASYSSLAAVYTELDDTSDECLALAQEHYERAVALDPRGPDYLYNLALSYWRTAQFDRAMASFDRAVELNPDDVKARWARIMLRAPAFDQKRGDDSPDGHAFGVELRKFEHWWSGSATDGAQFVGELQPFFLAYREQCNLDLMRQYGRVCAAAMQRWLERQKPPDFKRPQGPRIRLGVISGDIRMHSIWIALIQGWIMSLDLERFELVVFSLSDRTDAQTSWARTKADVFIRAPNSLAEWVAAIREQNCEILLYPAVGLDPMTLKLASLRLAPVQVNSWGHPETSGLPTMDYFLSADCLEPAAAQDHYSERLVLLPHLGNRLQPFALASRDLDLAAMDIAPHRPILLCPGTPQKYQPINDHVFVEIARSVPNAQLVFFRQKGSALSRLLEARLKTAFEAAGLDAAHHMRFIHWLSFQEFHSLLRRADLMLDSIGFSGYNTVVQAIECGLPLVTREGRFLRGRLASGVLRRLELTELIAQTNAEYVNLAVKLSLDPHHRERIRHAIQQRGPVLFDDPCATGPLQDFLASVARAAV